MKFHAILLAGILIASLVGLSNFDNAFAKHYEDDEIPVEDGMELLRAYTIFASKNDECTDYDESKLTFLRSITRQVLWKYNFQTIQHVDCVDVEGSLKIDEDYNSNTFGLTLHEAVEKAKVWHFDLLIIIFDDELSPEYSEEMRKQSGKSAWGHYRYFGDNKQIVITTSPHSNDISKLIAEHVPFLRDLQELEEQRGAWTLSHELAHFALEHLGYPSADWIDYVHDPDFNRCRDADYSYDFCSEMYFEITRNDDHGNQFLIKVMIPPYDNIKRWKELSEKTYSYTETPISLTEISTSSKVIEEGDKLWITGKVINPYSNYPVIVRVIDPSGSVLIDKEIRLDQYNQYRLSLIGDSSLMTQAGTYNVIVIYSDLVKTTTFSYTIPSETVQLTPIKPQSSQILECDAFDCYEGKVRGSVGLLSYTVNGIKNNYENLKEGDLLCVKYFLSYSSKDLQKRYPIPYGKISQEFIPLDDKRNPVSPPIKKYYQVNDSGELEICENFKVHSPSLISNGYQYRLGV